MSQLLKKLCERFEDGNQTKIAQNLGIQRPNFVQKLTNRIRLNEDDIKRVRKVYGKANNPEGLTDKQILDLL